MSCTACEWPVDRTCLPDLPVLGADPTPEQQAAYDAALAARTAAEDMAVMILWSLSGRRFGVCATTVRPCPQGLLRPGGTTSSPVVAWNGSDWINECCGCAGRCQLGGPRAVHLPGPAISVDSVTIGDELLEPTEYTLEGNVLYRVGASWPSQHLGRPLGEAGTWSVTYRRGNPVPDGVGTLVGLLAGEFLAACSGEKCRLPRNVTGVTRQGVSYQVYDPGSIYSSGKTGLAEVDLWLAAVNPNHLQAASVVL